MIMEMHTFALKIDKNEAENGGNSCYDCFAD